MSDTRSRLQEFWEARLPECSVLGAGNVRGADCWQLATALYVAEAPADLTFLTLDERQQRVAAAMGFQI